MRPNAAAYGREKPRFRAKSQTSTALPQSASAPQPNAVNTDGSSPKTTDIGKKKPGMKCPAEKSGTGQVPRRISP